MFRRWGASALAFTAVLLTGVLGFTPSAQAFATAPPPPGGGLSTATTPSALGMIGELSGALTPAQSAAMATTANASAGAATGATVPVGIAATSTAGGFSWSAILATGFPLLGFAPLLLGGLGGSSLTLPNDLSGLPPAVSSGSGISRADWTTPLTSSVPAWTLNGASKINGYSSRPSGTSVDLYRVPASYPDMTASGALACWMGSSCAVGSTNWVYAGSYSGSYADFPTDYSTYDWYFKVAGTGLAFFANPAPFTNPSPPRYVEQTVTCKRADGTTHSITMTTTPAEAVAGAVLTVAGILCPSGEKATSATRKLKADDATDVDLGSQTWPDTPEIPYSCSSTTVVVCQVRLQYAETPTTWKDCPIGVKSVCTGWASTPNKEDTYRCLYGTGTTWSLVTLSSCTTIPTDDVVADPPWVDVDTPESFCDFSWGDVLTGAIVFKAVGCALKWAFVPSSSTLTSVQAQVSTAWDGTAPAEVIGAVSDVSAPLRDLSEADDTPDCLGPEVDWDWGFLPHAHPFSTCSGLPATLSAFFKPILGAAVLLLALSTSVRTLGKTVGLSTPSQVA